MKYWIGTVSKEHVLRGVAGGFCQVCHGKAAPLNRMQRGDWLLYYTARKSAWTATTNCKPSPHSGRLPTTRPTRFR